MLYDLVVRDGKVFTGAGNPWFKADVGVKEGRIVEVGKILGDAKEVIEASPCRRGSSISTITATTPSW